MCDIYSQLEGTTKGLEKTEILARFLDKLRKENKFEYIYLLKGKVYPDYDSRELGLSTQLVIRCISRASGLTDKEVVNKFKELGDLGKVAEAVVGDKKKQSTLFSAKLDVNKVLNNLRKLPELEGQGTVDKKIGLVVELLNSSSDLEAKYIVRTVLGDLKIGVGNGILRDSLVVSCFSPEDMDQKKKYVDIVQDAYDKATDFAEVFERASRSNGEGELKKIKLTAGKPVKVMLYPKAKDVDDAFRIVGKPAAFEFKYDGFRVMINKSNDGEISIFTRRLDDVTNQFPDIVEYVEKFVKGDSFILDAEAVGYDPSTGEYKEFQAISQRIKRKYEIDRLVKKLPIELNVFDVIYYDDKSLIDSPFLERRKLLKKIVKENNYKIKLAEQIITSDEKEAEKFYDKALKEKQEGLMVKGLDKKYKPGARIGYAVKLKPEDKDFDLVITGAEWGTGKRAGWLTSFDVSCRDDDGNLLEIGKVSTGLKELKEQGLSFEELTEKLNKITTEEHGRKIKVKPEIVVTVQYQNIQKSPTYNSGYALRFPRIVRLRPDRSVDDIALIDEVEKEAK